MDFREDYELVLNHITAAESFFHFEDTFEDYKRMAFLWLNRKGRGLFEKEILAQYSEGTTIEDVITPNSDHYIFSGMSKVINGKEEKIWYDIMGMDVITSRDEFYDFFLTCKLRHIDLLAIDEFLEYHLLNGFNNNLEKFHRFLPLTMRKYSGRFLQQYHIDTVNEWMQNSKAALSGTEENLTLKRGLKRKAGDSYTEFTAEQTALLIHFLQEMKIILRDEYLNQTQAGLAFSALTGYSPQSLRQELGSERLAVIKANRENMDKLSAILNRLSVLVTKNVPPKK